MRCKCGFENAADARFCGNCRSALGDVPVGVVPNAAASPTAPPVAGGRGPIAARSISRARMAIVAVVVVVAAVGYWWMNRPPERYKPDNGGLYPINVDGKYGFMDRSGKAVITPQFDGVIGFSEGLASVRVGTKWGYINTKGVVAITPQFDFAMPFRYRRARVQLANRYGYIDKEGKYIGSPTFLWASEFSGEFAAVQTADRALALVNQSGKTVLLTNVDTLAYAFNSGLLPAASGGKWGFMDTTGKWVIDPQFEGVAGFADSRAPVKVGGRIGYVDMTGKFVVNPQYDQGNEFNEGYASFANGGKWGFIDTGGKEVCAAKFLAVGNFSDGLAPTQTEDGWGFIDKTCKLVVSPQFDGAESFQNGLAHVTALGKEAYITTTGAFVVNPFPGTTVLAEKARRAAEAADAEAKAAQAAAQANAEAAQAPTRSTQFPPLQPPPVADTTAFQRLLPGGARIIEAVDLTAIAGKARVMMLWMLSPKQLVRQLAVGGCVDWIYGDYWHGPTRLSLVDVGANVLLNTITIRSEDEVNPNKADTFNIPFLVSNKYYYVSALNAKGEGHPTVLHPRSFADSSAVTFPLFDYEACGMAATGAFGYSTTADQVMQFPVEVVAPEKPAALRMWVTQLFAQYPQAPGHWRCTRRPGHGSDATITDDVFFERSGRKFVDHQTITEAAQEAAVANAAKRSRVEHGIAGEWAGRFNNDPRGRLAISSSGSAIGATLQSSGWREAFNCELLQDGTLVLTGTGATRVGPSPNSTYSLDTLRLELDANRINFHGQYRDAQGHTGPVVFAKCPGWACLR